MNEYIKMAQEAAGENAHVAVALYYTLAADKADTYVEMMDYVNSLTSYAQNLKKETDKNAVMNWQSQYISNVLNIETVVNGE